MGDQPFPLTDQQVTDSLKNAQPEYDQIAGVAGVLRLLATPAEDPERQHTFYDAPVKAADEAFKSAYWWMKDHGTPSGLAWILAHIPGLLVFSTGIFGSSILMVLRLVGPSFALEVLKLVDDARKQLDPTVAIMSVAVMNELLGTDFTANHLATGEDVGAHLERASEIGGLFHQQLLREFKAAGDVTPEAGRAAGQRFTGFLINFGTATALLSIAGDIASFGKFEQFRELGVEVARNLGLGRLNRQVMKPLINTLITVPYQWWLNQQFHPTQFREGDLINPFTQTLMPHDVVFQAMDLLGYSQDKIEELIKLHQKRLTFDDVDLLLRYQIWTGDQAHQYILTLGYPEELATLVLYLVDLRKADKALTSLVDAMETSTVDGHTTPDEFSSLLNSLPLSEYDKRFRLQAVQYKLKAPHAHLTTAQAEKAFEEGLWTLDELDAYFTARGFSADDNLILQFQTLLALAKQADAAKVKSARAAAAAAKAAKKAGTTPPPAIA